MWIPSAAFYFRKKSGQEITHTTGRGGESFSLEIDWCRLPPSASETVKQKELQPTDNIYIYIKLISFQEN